MTLSTGRGPDRKPTSDPVLVNQGDYSPEDLPPRIAKRITINPVTGCWEWGGQIEPNGYGRTSLGSEQLAHRVVYILLIGPIPEGMTLDHVVARGCRSKACCWPAHLEPATPGENALRGDGPAALNARKTHCYKGHEFTPENTYYRPGRAWRHCRTCRRAAGERQAAKRRRAA